MTRREPPAETTAALRNAARDLMRTARELGHQVGEPGVAPSNVMASRIVDRARTEARQWPTREAQQRFLAEFAGEIRHEPREDGSPYGRFLDRIAAALNDTQAGET